MHLALFVPWQDFLSKSQGDITDIWSNCQAPLCPRLSFHVSNICLLRKSAEDAHKDAKLWDSRSDGDDTVDVEFPLDEWCQGEEPPTTAEHHQTYRALVQTLQSSVRNSDATKDSSTLQSLIRDLSQENPLEERRPFIQRHEAFYQQIRRHQESALYRYPTLSGEAVQAAAKAQDLLHLQRLDEIESGYHGVTLSARSADVDDLLASNCHENISFVRHGQDAVAVAPRIFVDISSVTGFEEQGHIAAANLTLNYLQTMALLLVCRFLDKYNNHSDSAGQHLQYIGGPGGTVKSRIVDALKEVFTVAGRPHLLQVTGTSGSAAARIGGTTIHSACVLDIHRTPNKPTSTFPEAKKWSWRQKLVLVIDEVSMLGGATLYEVSSHLQALRDCPHEPFGGVPVVLLMGDFYQFAPVRETSLLVNKLLDHSHAPLGQATISHHRGRTLWHMFKVVVLLEEQVRARDDPQLGALLDRVRAGKQTEQDLALLNTKLLDRSRITFHDGLRAITPLNRNRWSLNMEAVVDWARFNKKHISIFISTHTWRSAALSRELIARTLEQGDDSTCKAPGLFFYAQGMPVVVNKNIYIGLKVVNGAEFIAADVIPDPKYPGYCLADDITVHFGPPLGILLNSKETDNLAVPAMPPGTVLIRPISTTLDPTSSHFKFLPARCTRRGLPVAPAFFLTDYKAQGKTFVEVLLELRGNRLTNGQPSKCDFTSLYVQLSRCTTLQGIKLLNPIRRHDFIGNWPDQIIVDGMQRLRELAAETRRTYECHNLDM